jgi:hypothetical protein
MPEDEKPHQVTVQASHQLRQYKGRVTVQPGRSIHISDREDLSTDIPHAERRAVDDVVAATLAQYQRAAKQLLSGKYRELADVAPPHLRAPCDCWVVVGDDGIVVRWDRHDGDEKPSIRIAYPQDTEKTMDVLAPGFSEKYVYCVRDRASFEIPNDGQRLRIGATDPATAEMRVIVDLGVAAIVDWPPVAGDATLGTLRPTPIASLTNEVEIELGGEERDAKAQPGTGRQFVIASRGRLAVGWETFEIYPGFDAGTWRPELASAWAELDILAAAARRNLRQQQLNAIDPRAAARRAYARLLDEFQALLDGSEADLQQFLEGHPELLSPTHIQMWRKVKLGDHVTDLVFREPTDYVLVELEAPSRPLFRRDGHQTQELTHAIGQVQDWLRYIEENLDTVRRELDLQSISSQPQCLVVIGRSRTLADRDRKKLATIQRTHPKVRIVTYDDVLVAATQSIVNLLGSIATTSGETEVYYRA